ncbi:MAG: urea amidolyase family protein [Bifidobacterium sp.]|nr:urea amidolyase family protein [Bifidobacterium sp.]
MRFLNVGESALLIELDEDDAFGVMGLHDAIVRQRHAGDTCLSQLIEIVPAACTLLVRFDSLAIDRAAIEHAIRDLGSDDGLTDYIAQSGRARAGIDRAANEQTIDVPVVYDGEDLGSLAALLGISSQQLVERHTMCLWTAAFVGFAPGFAYLISDDPLFDIPRRQEPRVRVPAGAVGLAGSYSGVYPRQSSGGWQLIGSTALAVWDERQDPPALIRPGDSVRFRAVRERIAAADPTDALPSQVIAHTIGGPVCGLYVDRPGAFAIFEDDGRMAADMGVSGSGAADPTSLHRANVLAGNPAGAPAVEIAGGGACFTASGEVVVAFAGASAPIVVRGLDGSSTAIVRQEAFLLADGDRLELGAPRCGLRGYLAMQGGFQVHEVLGSASSDTMAHIGPDPIQAGDFLACAGHPHTVTGHGVEWARLPVRSALTELTLTLGPRDDWFTKESIDDLLTQCWKVTAHSDRVGLRLHGERPLMRTVTRELASEGTVAGAIEIPGNGQPVLFLRDHPVTGGYPVVAVLDMRSLELAGQLPAGALVRFQAPCRELDIYQRRKAA